jgi:hypothetical protein
MRQPARQPTTTRAEPDTKLKPTYRKWAPYGRGCWSQGTDIDRGGEILGDQERQGRPDTGMPQFSSFRSIEGSVSSRRKFARVEASALTSAQRGRG